MPFRSQIDLQERTDVVGDLCDFEFKIRVTRDIEGLAAPDIMPLRFACQTIAQLPCLDLHQFRLAGVELVFTGQHDAQRLDAAIRKLDRSAGDLAVEIDVCGFRDVDGFKLAHCVP